MGPRVNRARSCTRSRDTADGCMEGAPSAASPRARQARIVVELNAASPARRG